jgi:hypothetical protein
MQHQWLGALVMRETHRGELLAYLTFSMRNVARFWIMQLNLCAIQIFPFLAYTWITLAHEWAGEIS